jgi:hypothetical protein
LTVPPESQPVSALQLADGDDASDFLTPAARSCAWPKPVDPTEGPVVREAVESTP